MDLYGKVLELEEAQHRFATALGKLSEAILSIREDMKLLTSNEDVLSLVEFTKQIKSDLQLLSNDVTDLRQQLTTETEDRIAGDAASQANISGTNGRVTALESLTTTQANRIQTNANNIATINSSISSIQSAAASMPNIRNICQSLVTQPYGINFTNIGPTDGNGFYRANAVQITGNQNNDRIICIAPYDYRATNYDGALVAWTDYQSDGYINIQVKKMGSGSTGSLGNVSGIYLRVYYWYTLPTKGMPI